MRRIALLFLIAWGGLASAAAPNFHVVFAYEGVARYIQALREEPEAAPLDLFRKHVGEPYSECYLSPLPMTFFRAPNYLTELESVIEALRASRLEESVKMALKRSAKYLSGPDITVCIGVLDPNNAGVREGMNGITGWAGQEIVLEIYPEPGWLDFLPYVVAHEYHHVVMVDRYIDATQPATLLETLLLEGRADTFARQLYPNITPPWVAGEALSQEQEREQWAFMKSRLTSTDIVVLRAYLFGGGGIPRWTGYTIGFRIMETFLKRHPDLDVETWSSMEAEAILRLSGYMIE